MNRLTYFGQKNNVFGDYFLIAREFPSLHMLGVNATGSVSQLWTSEKSNSTLANLDFTYSLNYSLYVWTDSRNVSSICSLNTYKNIGSNKKNLYIDHIGHSNRDCSLRFDIESLTQFIGPSN